MSRIVILLLVALVAIVAAFPTSKPIPEVPHRIIRAAVPEAAPYRRGGYGHHGYGGHRGYGGYGGHSFANSGSRAGSISSPFGSASFAKSFANSGSRSYGR